MGELVIKPTAHVVDVLGNVIGRDQPILRMEKALEMASLLGQEIFLDENVVFFDPFCKAGEILFACAFHRCLSKVKSKTHLLDSDMVFQEIYKSNRYFGLAPDERHHRLSTRTFLGNTYSHDVSFNHVIRDGHYVSEIDGTLNKEKFEKEFKSMIEYIKEKSGDKKIIAIGNPPYQESDGGFGGSARAIYNYFTEMLMDSKDIKEFILVIPSRWFAVGKGVDQFREKVLSSTEIKTLHYFKKSKTVFPTVDVLGGVCFFHYEKNFKGKTTFIEDGVATEILLSEFDIIPDDPFAYPIIRKIKKSHSSFIDQVAWSRNPYGLTSTFFRDNESTPEKAQNSIKCLTRGRKFKYTSKNNITKNKNKIDYFKVVIPAAYAPGSKEGVRRVTLPVKQYFILGKDEITTETYTIIDIFKTKAEAERFVKYLQTDFARYLLGLRKITQHIPKDRWAWVPYMDTSKEWTDESLAEYFSLTKAEMEHMKKKVQEWS